MGYKFWIIRSLKVFIGISVLLFVVQLLKQHSFVDSIIFAFIWSFLSTSVFIGSRVYQSRKGLECTLCDDTPDSGDKTPNKQINKD